MAKSQAFAGIKRDVLQITAMIPPGRITTFKSVGDYMTVMPRHVAYILTMLSDDEKLTIPWHRVVGTQGKLGKPKADPLGRTQEELLQAEGIVVAQGVVSDFAEIFINTTDLDSGVQPQQTYQTT